MRLRLLLPLLLTLCLATGLAWPGAAATEGKPNILFIVADDLGWHDVGYRGGEIKTPNIDRMAAAGARLEQFYVLPVCTPTRASLMTGRYPFRYGFQSGVNRPWSTWGLPEEERTLAQALREAGYRTAITGKWHLGSHRKIDLPTQRGFDHQYGHYTGAIDYYTHERDGGLDWHRGGKALREEGYSTDLIGAEASRLIQEHNGRKPLFLYVPFNAPHSPLQAPREYLDQYAHLQNARRRTYAAMVTCMDTAIGRILETLEKKGMTRNTLVVFSSDNGGPEGLGANNGPLRGGKHSLYEGGTRVNAWAVWPGRIPAGRQVQAPLHMSDWHPTLLKLAGAKAGKLPLDGQDAWSTITGDGPGRQEIVLNLQAEKAALRQGEWKLLSGEDGAELFNLKTDPFEKRNLAAQEPDRVRQMEARIAELRKGMVPALGGDVDRQPRGWKAPAVYGEEE